MYQSLSHVRLCDPWTVAQHAPLSMEFSRQEYWSGLPFPSPGDLSDAGIEPGFPAMQADSLPTDHHLTSPLDIPEKLLKSYGHIVFPVY